MIALPIVLSVLCMQIRYRMFVVFIFKVIDLFRFLFHYSMKLVDKKNPVVLCMLLRSMELFFKCLGKAVVTKTHLTWQHPVGFSVQNLTKLYSLSICVISVCVSRGDSS